MPASRANPAAPHRWRLCVIGTILMALCAASMLWQPASQAGGAALEPQVAAFVKDKELHVAVALTKEASQPAKGTIAVELITGDGQRLAQARADVDGNPAVS